MNIVITQQNNGAASASLTQYNSSLSYLLSDIRVCYQNAFDPSEINITLISSQGFEYPCKLDLEKEKEIGSNFYIAPLTSDYVLLEDTYNIKVMDIIISSPVNIKTDPSEEGATLDEHNCLLVRGRTIQVVPDQVQLIEGDTKSQIIRFKIRKKYDNMSFLDEQTKMVEVDFIPADWESIKEESDIGEEYQFIVDTTNIRKPYEDPADPDYMIIEWTVPYAATQRAGTLKVALAISSKDDGGAAYLWQTSAASLTVMPAIGKHSSSVIPDDYKSPFIDLAMRLEDLENVNSAARLEDLEKVNSASRLEDLENIFNGEDVVVDLEKAGE